MPNLTRHRLPPLVPTVVVVLVNLALFVPESAASFDLPRSPSTDWLGVDGRPLPFTSDQEILEFLRHAEVIDRVRIESGITRPFKLTLERDGVRAHAVFRTVDENPISASQMRVRVAPDRQRDSYVFEVAAYEIASSLGLDRVPPVVLRTIEGRRGSLQLWKERARTEASRMQANEPPPQPATWHLQRQLMTTFDLLIQNGDRHEGNVLVDEDGKLWFIDHTRAFRRIQTVISSITVCERSFYERLKGLDPKQLRQRLRPYLSPLEIAALVSRRRQLVNHIDALIAERGEGSVLFELEEG